MNLENELREALRREAAPPDFAAKVLARVPKNVVAIPLWRRPAVLAIAAGLAVAAIVPPALSEYHRRQEARALEARRELVIALTITRTKLQEAKARIERTVLHTSTRHTL